MNGTNDAVTISVNAYPVAWKIEAVGHGIHRGFPYVHSEPIIIRHSRLTSYVRVYWGPTGRTWDLEGGGNDNGRKVRLSHQRQRSLTD